LVSQSVKESRPYTGEASLLKAEPMADSSYSSASLLSPMTSIRAARSSSRIFIDIEHDFLLIHE
jgi:hypothetical protein